MAAITICSDFGAPQNKVWHCFHCFPIYFPWNDGTRCHDFRFLNVELLANIFSFLFHFHHGAFLFLFTFCHKGGVICISEVIDISPSNLDSSLYLMVNKCGNSGNSVRFYFGGSKITADGDCSHEIKRRLLLGRKVMINLDSIFKSRDITLPTKFHLVKAMVFPLSCMDVKVGLWRKLSAEELMLLNCGVGENSWESLGLQGDPTSPFWRRSSLGFLWKEWC